jgi:hypothetical protein
MNLAFKFAHTGPFAPQLECMQRHICSVCIAEHQKSGAGGCVFPDCTAPATAIPAAELPTDQLILAKMKEAATSVSIDLRVC